MGGHGVGPGTFAPVPPSSAGTYYKYKTIIVCSPTKRQIRVIIFKRICIYIEL